MCIIDLIKNTFSDSVLNFPFAYLNCSGRPVFLAFCWSKEELADVAWQTLCQPLSWPGYRQGCGERDLQVMPVGCCVKKSLCQEHPLDARACQAFCCRFEPPAQAKLFVFWDLNSLILGSCFQHPSCLQVLVDIWLGNYREHLHLI